MCLKRWTAPLAFALVASAATSLAIAHDQAYVAVGTYHVLNPPTDCLGSAPISTPAFNVVCFPPGHIGPNANGDATLSVLDTLQSNVGFVVCQDTNRDGQPCSFGDWSTTACNQLTVNAFSGGWNPALTTYVIVNSFLAGSSALNPWPPCGSGVDSFGTTGNVNHS